MATVANNWFEIERRVVVFKTTTTMPDNSLLGYDGNPNNAVAGNTPGETLLYNSPLPTFYFQSNGTLWVKDTSPNGWSILGSSTPSGSLEETHPLSGDQDGVNTTFTTPKSFVLGSTKVYINGLVYILGVDYTETDSSTIELTTFVPFSTDQLFVEFRPA
jgi:hypothetical protein